MNNHQWPIPIFSISMFFLLFPFLLKFMCLNGVEVEVKWENLSALLIFFLLFFSMEIWNGSPLVQLHWILKRCVMNFFWPCMKNFLLIYLELLKYKEYTENTDQNQIYSILSRFAIFGNFETYKSRTLLATREDSSKWLKK
jgi:hypothetical protein